MSNRKSCFGCKFLYGDGQGYSNYTWMETFLRCALKQSEKLESRAVEKPYSNFESQFLSQQDQEELINITGESCSWFSPGPFVELCPDRDEDYKECCIDEDQYLAIKKSDGNY